MWGIWTFDVVRISFRNDSTWSTKCDCSLAKIFDSWLWINTVECWHWILCLKRLVCQFLKEHLNSSLRSTFFFEEVYTNSVRHVTFLARSTDFFAFSDLKSKRSKFLNCVSHTSCTVLCRYCVNFVLEHISTWVFNVHTSYCRDSEFFLYCITDSSACNTVTSSIESRSSDEDIRILALNHFKNISFCFVKVFIEVRVTANDCSYDLCFFSKLLCQSLSRSNDFAYAKFSRIISFFFSTNLSEELIDIMYNFNFTHYLYVLHS